MEMLSRSARETENLYRSSVNSHVLRRFRILTPIAILLHLAFTYFDRMIYPAWAASFLMIRVVDSVIILAFFLSALLRPVQRHIIWVMDICACVMSGGVILMIALTRGAASQYYEGVNLVILATALINGFYWRHNVGLYSLWSILYVAAMLHDRSHFNALGFQTGFYFLSSTGLFAGLLSFFYSRQHRETFRANLELKQSQTELSRLYEHAERLSKTDDLTQISNRRQFFDILSKKIACSERDQRAFYLVIFDVDHFKQINDRYGHNVGDDVLRSIAGIVKSQIRREDFFGRFGGDEFMILMDVDESDTLIERLESIREKIRASHFIAEGGAFSPSATFGAAKFLPGTRLTEKALIECADAELLKMKQKERGGISLAKSA